MKALAALVLLMTASGCAGTSSPGTPASSASPTSDLSSTSPATARPSVAPIPSATRTRTPRPADPRWVFFSDDKQRHASPWFPGRHRIMIGFGCTDAPYYSPDPACDGGDGFHHGIDVAIPCGTPLRAGREATVLPNDALGSAYGENPVLLRIDGLDVVIGHTRQVFVDVGDRVAKGERFALVSDAGAPDGCHLHFEVRQPGTGVSGAVDPAELLALR